LESGNFIFHIVTGYRKRCVEKRCVTKAFVHSSNNWEDNIKMGIGFEDGRWMELVQDRVQWQALVLEIGRASCRERV
jgi:hypothetical protein